MMNDAESAEIEAAWIAEANDRMTAYRNGEISSQSEDELFAEIAALYAPKTDSKNISDIIDGI